MQNSITRNEKRKELDKACAYFKRLISLEKLMKRHPDLTGNISKIFETIRIYNG